MLPDVPFLKRAAFAVFGSAPVLQTQLSRVKDAGALTILNLHRVDDHEGSAYVALKPSVFDALVGWLRQHFRITTFAGLAELSNETKPPLILSFDDGYKDFIDVVAPILRRHGVKANQNVIPDCAETGRPPLNVMLQDFIGMAPPLLLREMRLPGCDAIDPDDRMKSGRLASAALKNRPMAEQRALFESLGPLIARFDAFQPTPVMNADEIRSLVDEHEIGAHSWEHASMAYETNDYLAGDAARCWAWCAEHLGSQPNVYAFPNGSAREGQAEIVRAAGFQTVLDVGENFSRRDAWHHQRFTIFGATLPETRLRALGSFRRPPAQAAPRQPLRGAA